jgi:hypothetical protein
MTSWLGQSVESVSKAKRPGQNQGFRCFQPHTDHRSVIKT